MGERPLLYRLYEEPVLYETARLVGYEGIPSLEVEEKIAPLLERFEEHRVEWALHQLTTYGSFDPEQARHVRLRSNVRPLCFQLLGPPPESPERAHFEEGAAWVPPWARRQPEPAKVEEPAPDKPKRSRKKKVPS